MSIGGKMSEALPVLTPGTDEWLRSMSASKIAAVAGLSPYESAFSLWHRMAGLLGPEPDKEAFRRGHYLEPAIAAWFADQHPAEFVVAPTATFMNGWRSATPDRVLYGVWDDNPTALLECKSVAHLDEWGEPGTDQVPAGYHAQCQWQMHVSGLPVTYVAMIGPFLRFEEYVVRHDPAVCEELEALASAFMDSLPTGANPQRPNTDGHESTYSAVRALHPTVEPDLQFDVPDILAVRYIAATSAVSASEATKRAVTAELADLMGDAKKAVHRDRVIAQRLQRNGGTPYLQTSKGLA